MADFDLDEVLDEYEPPTQSVQVCTKGSVNARLEQLEAEWEAARREDQWSNQSDRAPRIAEEIDALRGDAKAHTRTFVFQSVGEDAWARLQDEHPPSKEQRKEGFQWAPESFIPAAIHACSLEPRITERQARVICKGDSDAGKPAWSSGQIRKMFDACVRANGGAGDIPKGSAAIASLRRTESGSTSASGTDGS